MLVEILLNHVKCIGYTNSLLYISALRNVEHRNSQILSIANTHTIICEHTMSSDVSLALLATPRFIDNHQWDPQQTTRNMEMVTIKPTSQIQI